MEALKIISACQGAYILGVTIVIFLYYVKSGYKDRSMKYHVIAISISYIFLTVATMISIYREVYQWGDPWFLITFVGYICGDVSLMTMLRRVVRNKNLK